VLTAYHLAGAVPIKRPVALPADFPMVEKRAPIGLAVLTVLLVLGAGYAAWHYLPREQAIVAEKVPPVPDRLLASRPAGPSTTEALTPTPAAAPPAATTSATSPRPSREAGTTPGAPPADVWPVVRRESVAPPTHSLSQPAPLAPPVVIAVPAPPVVMTNPAIGQAQAAQPPTPVDQPKANGTEEATARSSDAATAPSLPVKVDTPVRVRTNSWVELRAPNGDILAQTYVRAGESYVVPAGIAYRVIDAR
jgi:cytoskeleton protein RodZ